MNDYIYDLILPSERDHTNSKDGATEAVSRVLEKSQISGHMAKIPTPTGAGKGNLNIVKDYRWTKSVNLNNVLVKNTPTITLREMQVVSPAFFHNATTIINQIAGDTGIIQNTNTILQNIKGNQEANTNNNQAALLERAQQFADVVEGPKTDLLTSIVTSDPFVEFVGNMAEGAKTLKTKFQEFKKNTLNHTRWSWASYLKEYESLYGVNPTRFVYYLPYLEDSYKQISTSWGNDSGGLVTKTISTISELLRISSPAVGVDLAKTYNYPDSGPSHDVNFYLDNTVINGESQAHKNYRFIFLLLYQNLPNKITQSQLTPPVIYQSSLPGVFSYRWSYLSKLVVNYIGNRRPMNINVTKDINANVIVPEGFEVQLTITSLLPETKNLMYDSIAPAVESFEFLSTDEPLANPTTIPANPGLGTGGSPGRPKTRGDSLTEMGRPQVGGPMQ